MATPRSFSLSASTGMRTFESHAWAFNPDGTLEVRTVHTTDTQPEMIIPRHVTSEEWDARYPAIVRETTFRGTWNVSAAGDSVTVQATPLGDAGAAGIAATLPYNAATREADVDSIAPRTFDGRSAQPEFTN